MTIGKPEEKEQTAEEKLQLIENALNFLNDKEDDKKEMQENATLADKINENVKAVYNLGSFLANGGKKYKKRRSF